MSKDGNSSGAGAVALFAVLHLLCCGLPLLLLSGVSLSFVAPSWPIVGGALAALGVIGFVWYLKRGCATCPRNEGRCIQSSCSVQHTTKADHG